MPFELIIHDNLLEIHPSGAITRQCISFMAGEVISAEQGMNPVLNRITDLTLIQSFDITFETVWSLAQLRRAQVFPNQLKSAIVATKPIEIGFALMFKTLNDNPQIEIRLFKTLEEARRWAAAPDQG